MTHDSRPARERIDAYLRALRTRLRVLIYTRAAAAAFVAVLLVTCVGVVLLSRTGFAASIALGARIVLLSLLVAVAVWLWWRPLRQLNSAHGASEFERRLPAQQGRIQTYLDMQRREARGERTAFAELLAEDAARVASMTPVESVIVGKQVWIPALVALAALAVVLGLLMAGPAQWGYGSRHLLLGAQVPRNVIPERLIRVKPGDTTVRRNSDLSIVATMQGFAPENAAVYVRFDGEQTWQRAPMQSQLQRDGSEAWAFKLYALRGPLHYYVAADTARSSEHRVGVADLPKIEKVRLTYVYPQWTGLQPVTDEAQRDIRAVAATQVKVEVLADAPLQAPALIVNGEATQIDGAGNTATGSLTVGKPGNYFVGAKVLDDFVPLTEDYQIEVVADEKPSIEILKPGRDWRATSIEEVPVRVQARDDFRLQDVELRYAVNGGKWLSVNLDAGQREINSESMLRLEELGADAKLPAQLAPGDLVSYYAVAKDRSKQVQTDLFMVQVQPFERRFIQNSAGGGGGGGEEQGAISERQKEILLATWNLQRSDNRAEGSPPRTPKQLQENAVMLSELQTTLAQQARTVAERMRARVPLDQDQHVKAFVESMESAAAVMDPAAEHLKNFKLDQAVPVEQQALQQLLRAESAFREVQVSMQQESASNGGGEAARNFSEMFELEMDLQKNQYETESQLSQAGRQQELDEAIRKLKELAERQEKLAQQAERKAIPPQDQRWRQEQLRREAEDLKRRLAELSREQQGGAPQGRGSNRQSSRQSSAQADGEAAGESSDEQPTKPQQNGAERERERERLANTLQSLTKALDEMRAANAQSDAGEQRNPQGEGTHRQAANDTASGNQSATEASRKLRQALKQMERPPEQGLAETVERLAQRAGQLTDSQRDIESELHQALNAAQQTNGRRGSIAPRRARELAEDKLKMSRELTRIQSEIRDTAHDHRKVLYGRAWEAAAREGLIEEALQLLEQGLRDSATLAAQGRDPSGDEATPEQMLARIAELRRALQQAQHGQGDDGERRIASLQQSLQQSGQQSGQPSQQQPGQSLNGASQSPSQGGRQSGAAGSDASRPNGATLQGNGPSGSMGLSAWNPATPGESMLPERGAGRYREAAELSEQMRNLANRMQGRDLSNAEIAALRRMTQDLRRLAGDPMAEAATLAQLVDRIELAALSAAEKTKDRVSSRTTVQHADDPEYRDAVAEYYRRLGAIRPGSAR